MSELFPAYIQDILAEIANVKRTVIIKIFFENKSYRFSEIQRKLNDLRPDLSIQSNKLAYHLRILQQKKILKRIIVQEKDENDNSQAVIKYQMTKFCYNLIQKIKSVVNFESFIDNV